jgi:hypothetical protein
MDYADDALQLQDMGIVTVSFRRAAKVDRNQPEIVDAFRKMGCAVLIISQLKKCADLVVSKNFKTAIVEVKDGELSPSKKMLTEGESEFMKGWKGMYFIVEDLSGVQLVVRNLES